MLIDIFNRKAIEKKTAQALLGLCGGLVADNELNEKEFAYLRQWMLEHRELLNDWPGPLLWRKMNDILEDGIITKQELEHLRDVLVELLGGNLESEGTVKNLPTKLPLNQDASVEHQGKTFCFTGKFIYGSRDKCSSRAQELGGECLNIVRTDLDYLVIGTIGSDSWMNTSYGRKIQKAIDFQQKGHPVFIVNEEMWLAV